MPTGRLGGKGVGVRASASAAGGLIAPKADAAADGGTAPNGVDAAAGDPNGVAPGARPMFCPNGDPVVMGIAGISLVV